MNNDRTIDAPEDSGIKICVNCKHYRPTGMCVFGAKAMINIVSGEKFYRGFKSCADQRTSYLEKDCLRQAKFFEPKEVNSVSL